MIQMLRRGVAELTSFVLPRLCCGCGQRILDHSAVVCQPCLGGIPALMEPVCSRCGAPDARIVSPGKCAHCPAGTAWFHRARAVAPFTGISQPLIFRLKYGCRKEYAPVLAHLMTRFYKEGTREIPGSLDSPDLVIPVPLHSTRLRERGFNQSALLAAYIARELGVTCDQSSLKRIRPTTTQTRLKKRDRIQNVENAFACVSPENIVGRRVLLIDDVYTTGSTINECARVLIKAGAASVECLAFARAILEKR